MRYKIWIAGVSKPVELTQEGDKLREDFIEWLMSGNEEAARGFVYQKGESTKVISFANVAYMEVDPNMKPFEPAVDPESRNLTEDIPG